MPSSAEGTRTPMLHLGANHDLRMALSYLFAIVVGIVAIVILERHAADPARWQVEAPAGSR